MSIGIIELFQLVSIWSFCILIIVYCVCMLSISIIYWWLVLILFHTHIYVLFVLLYFYILSTNLVYARAWALILFQLIHFSIGILFSSLRIVLVLFHKKHVNHMVTKHSKSMKHEYDSWKQAWVNKKGECSNKMWRTQSWKVGNKLIIP